MTEVTEETVTEVVEQTKTRMAEAVVLVVDTGATAAAGNPSFLSRALACASGFVERKLYSESKDVLGLVLFGCQETANPLGYEGVRVVGRGLALADWDTVTFLREQVRGSSSPSPSSFSFSSPPPPQVEGSAVQGDWIDALVVSLDFLKGQTEGKKFTALKIVLFRCEARICFGNIYFICSASWAAGPTTTRTRWS